MVKDVKRLIEVFEDTQSLCKSNPILAEACRESCENRKIYLEKDKIRCEKNKFEENVKIVVSKKRTLEAAEFYKNGKVVVLNFASSINPGGGVKEGSVAQEECLCRCSTLYESLIGEEPFKMFYCPHLNNFDALANDDAIFTPGVKVFKRDVHFPTLLPEDQWWNVDVITCAAPDMYTFNELGGAIEDNKFVKILDSRWRRILDIACENGAETVVLGAFGCGAFGNHPKVVAECAKKVLEDYLHAFRTIEFAIYCNKMETENYKVFKEVLDK